MRGRSNRTRTGRGLRRLLGAALALPVVLPAALVLGQEREPDPEMGGRLVGARCEFCHKEESLPRLVEHCVRSHGADYLDEFLRKHHAPDDQARADIIAFLTCPP